MTTLEMFKSVLTPILFFFLVISLVYLLIGRTLYSRPNRTFALGMILLILGVIAKSFMVANKDELASLMNFEPAILFVEFSILAIAGSFIGNAFQSKSQIIHNKWKSECLERIATKRKHLSNLNQQLIKQKKLVKKMTPTEHASNVLSIIERIEKLSDDIDKLNIALQKDSGI